MHVPRKQTTKYLKWATRQKYFLPIRDRIRIVILAIRGKTIKEISSQMECCSRNVQKWVARYRINGIDSLWNKPRPGAPKKLAEKFEEEFVERIFNGPIEKDKVSIFNGLKIREILENEFRANYTLDGVYALLKRLKLTWVTSRPVHEKNDLVKMAEWKTWFTAEVKKRKKEHAKKLRYGSKMKHVSDKRGICIGFGQREDIERESSNNLGSNLHTYSEQYVQKQGKE
jgi:transposase